MRKIVVCAQMMTLCLILVACGQNADTDSDELVLEIRAEYIELTTCAGQMELTADYGERVYEYTLDFSYEKEGELVLTVVEPESIAGISAHVKDGSTTLEYDGTALETGPLTAEGLSPIDGLPVLLTYAREGCIAECGFETIGETESLRICCREPENQPGQGTEGTLWFRSDTHELLRGEISTEGYVVVRCEFTSFTFG